MEKEDIEAFLKEFGSGGVITKLQFDKLFKEGPEGTLKRRKDLAGSSFERVEVKQITSILEGLMTSQRIDLRHSFE